MSESDRTAGVRLGAARAEVIASTGLARDAGVIRVGAGRVMAVSTGPLAMVPALGAEDSARLACRRLASDVWTSGIPPAFATTCLTAAAAEIDAYEAAANDEFERLGIAILARQTARSAGAGVEIVGAASMWGLGDEGRTIGPSFIQPGDRVLMTKDCAVEAVALATRLFPQRLAGALDEEQLARLSTRFSQASVVADCRAALRVGVRDRGVAALHDAGEGGLLAALLELAQEGRADLRVSTAAMLLAPDTRAVCELLGVDPLRTSSFGTLVVVARSAWALEVMSAVAEEDIAVAEIGEVVRGPGHVWLTDDAGQVEKITSTPADGWRDACDRAAREGWT